MHSRFQQEAHQRRLAAALVTGTDTDRTAFLTGLLHDDQLVQDARASFVAHLRREGLTGPLLALAAEDSLGTVLNASFHRLDDLLAWRSDRAPLAGWWGLQALYEFNNNGRRFAERGCGYHRASGETLLFVSDHQPDEAGTMQPLPLADEAADPAIRFERAHAAADLEALMARAEGHPALTWLRDWVAADALHSTEPVTFDGSTARLSWRYGAQQALASHLGVTSRTLRNRARDVEALLLTLSDLARAA